jgi:hypothetical protein
MLTKRALHPGSDAPNGALQVSSTTFHCAPYSSSIRQGCRGSFQYATTIDSTRSNLHPAHRRKPASCATRQKQLAMAHLVASNVDHTLPELLKFGQALRDPRTRRRHGSSRIFETQPVRPLTGCQPHDSSGDVVRQVPDAWALRHVTDRMPCAKLCDEQCGGCCAPERRRPVDVRAPGWLYRQAEGKVLGGYDESRGTRQSQPGRSNCECFQIVKRQLLHAPNCVTKWRLCPCES